VNRESLAPIAALTSSEEGAAFVVRGRVVDLSGDAGVVVDASGRVAIRGFTEAHRGALVRARIERRGDAWRADSITVLASPRTGSLSLDGDVRRLLRAGGLERIAARSHALAALRGFFAERGYLEVETPTLVTNPGMDVHLDAYSVVGTGKYLATSPEYAMKRLVAAGLERIFQVTRSYRRDEAGDVHEPEFTICEWYRADASADEVMTDTEALVACVVAACNRGSTVVERGGRSIDVAPPWKRITVRDAIRVYADADVDALLADPDDLFHTLSFVVQPRLGEDAPVWLVDWPIALASLARPSPSDPSVAERFEAYAQGLELCNGFGELTDPVEQRRRFEADLREREALGKESLPIDERFLTALDDGLPECAGNALGFDRLVMLALGLTTIDDVLTIGARRS